MENAIWDDGEWVGWDDINDQIQCQDWRIRYPKADLRLVPIFESLIETAQSYHDLTGRHLQVFGDIGELWGAIKYGLRPHRNYARGSDGRIGNDFIEVKTITPFNKNDCTWLDLKGHFSRVLIVKINEDFEIRDKLIDRKALPKTNGDKLRLDWAFFDEK